MRFILVRGLRVMVASLFMAGLICPEAALFSMPAAAGPDTAQDSYIWITFSGLMIFDKQVRDGVIMGGISVGGTQKIWLHSQAEHHKVTIQIKGPQFDDEFIDWGHSYEKDEDLKLEVKNSDGSPVPNLPSPTWPSTTRPFQIDSLHPAATDGLLVMRPDQFGPTLTIYSGVFNTDRLQTIKFESDADPRGQQVPNVPRLITARIPLSGSQKAVLSASHGLAPFEMTGGPWEIRVRNNPDLGNACRDDHFKSYYDGFNLVKDGFEKPVDPNKRYKAIALDAPSCKSDNRALPTRPCIPISP